MPIAFSIAAESLRNFAVAFPRGKLRVVHCAGKAASGMSRSARSAAAANKCRRGGRAGCAVLFVRRVPGFMARAPCRRQVAVQTLQDRSPRKRFPRA